MKQKIYNNIDEWYSPDIDYWEMLHNFQWTKDPVRETLGYKSGITYNGQLYTFPLDHVTLMFHAKAWEIDLKTKKEIPGKQQRFQFWNKQFNNELVNLLNPLKPKLILDVCAGDGTLSKILSNKGFNIKAVDNFSWPFQKRYFTIEKLGYKEALEKYQPDVVIGSWMPLHTNWTPDFRHTQSVKHYIIIGEVDACCGGDWKKKKGWKVHYANEASKFALCRTDDLWWNDNKLGHDFDFMMHHSQVYLFSRKENYATNN